MNLCKWLGRGSKTATVWAATSTVRRWLRIVTNRRYSDAQAKASRGHAWVLLENGDFDAAVKLFSACLIHQPNCPDALRGLRLAIARKRVNAAANDNRQRPRVAG